MSDLNKADKMPRSMQTFFIVGTHSRHIIRDVWHFCNDMAQQWDSGFICCTTNQRLSRNKETACGECFLMGRIPLRGSLGEFSRYHSSVSKEGRATKCPQNVLHIYRAESLDVICRWWLFLLLKQIIPEGEVCLTACLRTMQEEWETDFCKRISSTLKRRCSQSLPRASNPGIHSILCLSSFPLLINTLRH